MDGRAWPARQGQRCIGSSHAITTGSTNTCSVRYPQVRTGHAASARPCGFTWTTRSGKWDMTSGHAFITPQLSELEKCACSNSAPKGAGSSRAGRRRCTYRLKRGYPTGSASEHKQSGDNRSNGIAFSAPCPGRLVGIALRTERTPASHRQSLHRGFWLQCWHDGQTGFHRHGRDAVAAKHGQSLQLPPIAACWHVVRQDAGHAMAMRRRQAWKSWRRKRKRPAIPAFSPLLAPQCAATPLASILLAWYSSSPMRLIRPSCCSSHQAWSSSVSRNCAIRMSRLT